MRIIKRSTLASYWRKYPKAEMPLRQWMDLTKEASWNSLQDVRSTFPYADRALVASGNTVMIFDIGGNDYRLIVTIKFQWGIVYVRDFMTHAEYSKDSWKKRH